MKHYVYKITNLKNNKIYIGVRTSPSPKDDEYMGSSKIMENLYKLEGVKNFKKEIIKVFNTRKKAEDFESSLLTEDFCNDPNTYNIQNTGNYSEGKHGFRKDLWYDYYDEIRNKYLQGKNTKELGEFYNCDNGTIRHIVNNIKRTNSEAQQLRFKKHITSGARNLELDNHIPDIIELYNKGNSIVSIAEIYKVDSNTIKRRLEQDNIKIRNHKESQKLRDNNSRWRKDIWEHQKEIVSLYGKIGNMAEISRRYKVDMGTVKNILNKNGIINTKRKKI
jgi:hypothetical protein